MKSIAVRTTWIRESVVTVPDNFVWSRADEDEWVADDGSEWTMLHDWELLASDVEPPQQ